MSEPKLVALPAEPRQPDTLVDFYRRAVKELGEPIAYWLFQNAKAQGRRAVADRKLKRSESTLSSLEYRAAVLNSDAASALIMANAPHPTEFYRLETELADAVEQVAATENVIAHLKGKQP